MVGGIDGGDRDDGGYMKKIERIELGGWSNTASTSDYVHRKVIISFGESM